MKTVIYGLRVSNEDQIRYIGQTRRNLQLRLKEHVKIAVGGGRAPVYCWIRKHHELGQTIEIVPICIGSHNTTEIDCISRAKALSWQLLNSTDGGEGINGYQHTEERKLKCARIGSQNGRWGKPCSEEHRRKISESKRGQKYKLKEVRYSFRPPRTEETKRKISEALKNRRSSAS